MEIEDTAINLIRKKNWSRGKYGPLLSRIGKVTMNLHVDRKHVVDAIDRPKLDFISVQFLPTLH